MPCAPLKIKSHLSYEEIGIRYRKCKNPVEKSRWHLIWLMANPQKDTMVTEAAKTVGFCNNWARIIVYRYNEGPENLIDQRKNNLGKTPFLTEKQQKKLKDMIIKKRPPDGGLWTGPKVAAWIEKETKKHITGVGAWKWLRKSGFTLQVPRPKNIQSASEEETIEFKKNWKLNS